MTNEQILKKVLKKVGYISGLHTVRSYIRTGNYRNIIFSQDFAKAFWGEEHDFLATGTWNQECRNCHETKTSGEILKYECWQYGLLVMVLEKDPIKYLERFI